MSNHPLEVLQSAEVMGVLQDDQNLEQLKMCGGVAMVVAVAVVLLFLLLLLTVEEGMGC